MAVIGQDAPAFDHSPLVDLDSDDLLRAELEDRAHGDSIAGAVVQSTAPLEILAEAGEGVEQGMRTSDVGVLGSAEVADEDVPHGSLHRGGTEPPKSGRTGRFLGQYGQPSHGVSNGGPARSEERRGRRSG